MYRALRIFVLVCLVPVVLFACLAVVDGLAQLDAQEPTTRQVDVTSIATNSALERTGRFYSGTFIASDPSILQAPGGLTMYYTDLDASRGRTVIAAARSADGNDWTPVPRRGAVFGEVLAGQDGSWAENVESASVVRTGGQYRLYFSGYRDKGTPMKGFPAALGVVMSGDGVNFPPIEAQPIMQPTAGWYDNDAIYSPTILVDNGTYYMIYVGHAYSNTSQIGTGGVYLLAATSSDGLNWDKQPEPIARPGQFGGWMSEGLAEPYLVRDGQGGYLLFFTGLQGEERAIGVASGPTPLGPFTFGREIILQNGSAGMPDEHQVLAPAALLESGKLRVWYLAANSEERLSIGQAEADMEELRAISRR